MVLSPTLAPDMSSSSSRAWANTAWRPGTSISSPSGAASCMPSSQVFHSGNSAAPVQGHDGGGRVVQHGLNPAVRTGPPRRRWPWRSWSWSVRDRRRRIWSRSPSAPARRRSPTHRHVSAWRQTVLLSSAVTSFSESSGRSAAAGGLERTPQRCYICAKYTPASYKSQFYKVEFHEIDRKIKGDLGIIHKARSAF